MSNFFYTGSESGYICINLDQVRQVVRDKKADTVTIFFDKEHTIQFDGERAKEFMDVLTRQESEAGQNSLQYVK